MIYLRRGLNGLYALNACLAALCLLAILLLTLSQMLARWTGNVLVGASDYAGYCMAAASFFGFATALNHGYHIRVGIVLNALPKKLKHWLNTICFIIGAAVMWYFVWFAGRFVYWSWKFAEISQSEDKTALWIPQMAMLIGASVLAIALTDHLLSLIVNGDHNMKQNDID